VWLLKQDYVGDNMHILYANTEAQVQALQVTSTLVPPDRITSIRIRFYQLRLAKSDIFTPRLYLYQETVDDYVRSREEDFRTKTLSNSFTGLGKKLLKAKDSDCDSGYSDG